MITEHLAATMRALQPTHPGWNGTPRPESITSIADLAARYLTLLDELDLTDVVVVGSSIGGWIGGEMAVGATSGRITQLVLIDAVGIDVPGHPMTDFFALDAHGVAEHAFHDSARFYVDPATLTAEQATITEGNLATMKFLAGDPYMHDPELHAKLAPCGSRPS